MKINEFEKIVEKYKEQEDKTGNHLDMHSLIISDNEGNYFKHIFNNEADGLRPVRSLCKAIVSMCYGLILYDENCKSYCNQKLNFETKIWPIIESKVNLTNYSNLEKLKKIKLIHLFTHTIGFNVKLLKTKDIKDLNPNLLLDMVCNTTIKFNPGEVFLYSNASAFLLSVIFQEVTGINLAKFAEKHIFLKLGINLYKWRNYGPYCCGATGLELSCDDLHKIARLIFNNGKYLEKQIIPLEWMIQMKKPQILTPTMYDESRVFPKYAYGLLMWLCGIEENSNYFIDGSEGQYIIIVPKREIVITTTAQQSDMKPITECLRELL